MAVVGILGVVAAAVASLTGGAVENPRPAPAPAAAGDSHSRVLTYLRRISGSWTIAGQHNREPLREPARWTGRVEDITGVVPGVYGSDFAFTGIAARQAMVDAASAQWRAGALVTLMWHMCPPTVGDTCDWRRDIQGRLSDAQWKQLLTDGTPLNRAWKARMDTVVPFLRQLQARGVEVLWRPDHELNDDWAWWSGRPGADGSSRLFRMTHDYLTGKGLTNLVWVWSIKDVNTDSFAAYYPGDAYVDVVGLDSWMSAFPSTQTYERVRAVAGSKPMALTEVGTVPTPSQLSAQPRWTYFMVWAEMLTERSTLARIQYTYGSPRVITRGEIALPPVTPAGAERADLARGRPVRASSSVGEAFSPARAVDGDAATRWSSAPADPQWIAVDLGRVVTVDLVRLDWETARAVRYRIDVSEDGTSWAEARTVRAGAGEVDTVPLGGVRARYVRVYGLTRATRWGYSLWSLSVDGH